MCDQRLRAIRYPDGCKNLQTYPWRWRKCLYVNVGLCQRKTGVPTSISPKTVKPHSSHTIQALTLICRPQSATSYVTPRWAHSAVASFLSVFTAGLWIYPCVFLKAFQPSIFFTTCLNSTLSPLIPAPGCPLGPRGPSKPRSPCEHGQRRH